MRASKTFQLSHHILCSASDGRMPLILISSNIKAAERNLEKPVTKAAENSL
jgi:hypothetical protein